MFIQLVIIISLLILFNSIRLKDNYFPIRYDPNLYPSEIVSPLYVNLYI